MRKSRIRRCLALLDSIEDHLHRAERKRAELEAELLELEAEPVVPAIPPCPVRGHDCKVCGAWRQRRAERKRADELDQEVADGTLCARPGCLHLAELFDPSGAGWCLWDALLSPHGSTEPGWRPVEDEPVEIPPCTGPDCKVCRAFEEEIRSLDTLARAAVSA